MLAMQLFYHGSSTQSTPHQPSPQHAHPLLSPLHHRDFRLLQNENSFTIKIPAFKDMRRMV
jgi:hypothetical protein